MQPKSRPLHLSGLHAYAWPQSISAGESLSLFVSSDRDYTLKVSRLGCSIDSEDDDEYFDIGKDEKTLYAKAKVQPIHPGSYLIGPTISEKPLMSHENCSLKSVFESSFCIQGWVRIFDILDPGDCCIFSINGGGEVSANEFGIFIDKEYMLSFGYAGIHKVSKPLEKLKWHHFVASINVDSRKKSVWVDGNLYGCWEIERELVNASNGRVIIGGCLRDGVVEKHLNGDLAMISVHGRELTENEIMTYHRNLGLKIPEDSVICYDFHEEGGDTIHDISANGLDATLINHGTWMIGGPSFDAGVVKRFGDYNPMKDQLRGHGLRLSSDDIVDCEWDSSHHISIPSSARPGFYAAKFYSNASGHDYTYCVTFVVKRKSTEPKAPICVIASSNTWSAYNASRFGKNIPGLLQPHRTTQGIENDDTNPPAHSFYRFHRAGQGTYYMGKKTPCPCASPYVIYSPVTMYSHLTRVERFFTTWLEQQNYDYDVIDDSDLDKNPETLFGHKVVVLNGHNEYWSIRMYFGLDEYLRQGGNLLCLSGNTSSWRVSFNEDHSVIECRKVDFQYTREQVPLERRGECYHSQDKLRGGPMRECGMAGVHIHGLESMICSDPNNTKQFGPYIVENPNHFLFQSPEKVDVSVGTEIGGPLANGHEMDVRCSTINANQILPNPEGAISPTDPIGIELIGVGIINEVKIVPDFFWQKAGNFLRAGEMIYWARPNGGRVVNFGSINAGFAINEDPRLQAFVRNTLHHFGVQKEEPNKQKYKAHL